jgi:uncharacterized membrane protein
MLIAGAVILVVVLALAFAVGWQAGLVLKRSSDNQADAIRDNTEAVNNLASAFTHFAESMESPPDSLNNAA